MANLQEDEKNIDRVDDSTTVLPWDRFSSWLHCAAVVTFDLELGQALEVTNHLSLNQQVKIRDITFLCCIMSNVD